MYTHSELMEVLGEADMVMIIADFWCKYHDRLDPGKSKQPEAYDALLAAEIAKAYCLPISTITKIIRYGKNY